MPYKTALTFTCDRGEFEKNMDMALNMAHAKSFEQRRAEAKKRGKLRGLGISQFDRTCRRAGLRGRGNAFRPGR